MEIANAGQQPSSRRHDRDDAQQRRHHGVEPERGRPDRGKRRHDRSRAARSAQPPSAASRSWWTSASESSTYSPVARPSATHRVHLAEPAVRQLANVAVRSELLARGAIDDLASAVRPACAARFVLGILLPPVPLQSHRRLDRCGLVTRGDHHRHPRPACRCRRREPLQERHAASQQQRSDRGQPPVDSRHDREDEQDRIDHVSRGFTSRAAAKSLHRDARATRARRADNQTARPVSAWQTSAIELPPRPRRRR